MVGIICSTVGAIIKAGLDWTGLGWVMDPPSDLSEEFCGASSPPLMSWRLFSWKGFFWDYPARGEGGTLEATEEANKDVERGGGMSPLEMARNTPRYQQCAPPNLESGLITRTRMASVLRYYCESDMREREREREREGTRRKRLAMQIAPPPSCTIISLSFTPHQEGKVVLARKKTRPRAHTDSPGRLLEAQPATRYSFLKLDYPGNPPCIEDGIIPGFNPNAIIRWFGTW
ncbi:hypothetical protein K504DRAFT_445620 [Pleomassaria siparia CBS 279.74]|uniref:Uncharacterized protein n=1 Tax=Pleomassaria siparia CBS 279.74 TaxID=1314801 RepID=A0A6G1KP77_9PLEO|nr:hypothetical protein K504DRAFT_445620 [Pleomassaria siparia CBS 279.74]